MPTFQPRNGFTEDGMETKTNEESVQVCEVAVPWQLS